MSITGGDGDARLALPEASEGESSVVGWVGVGWGGEGGVAEIAPYKWQAWIH